MQYELSGKSLRELPSDFFQQHEHLESLCVTNCTDLDDFLPAIGQLKSLQFLGLSSNQLTEVPPEIGQLHNLKYLHLRENQIAVLPPELGQLHNLEDLDLRENQIAALPPELGQLYNLGRLDLRENQIAVLPPELGQLYNLKILYLQENQIAVLPPEIGQLQNLKYLELRANQISILPPEIGQLHNLADLQLQQNKLTKLPHEIGQLHNLERIFISDNPIQDLSALANHPYRCLKVFASRVELPRQYWTRFSEWKTEWLFTEKNAELRRLLIQQIGYDRICQELQTTELDTWREYKLLRVRAHVDVEPIHLLKMTCPSTNHIHVLRVPPNLTFAWDAIRWVNWDIDPEAFAKET